MIFGILKTILIYNLIHRSINETLPRGASLTILATATQENRLIFKGYITDILKHE